MKNSYSKKQQEKVSIIIPTYNCEDFIGKTLDSVLKQTYENWEVIVVDDSSTDCSEGVIKEYMKNDSRIRYEKLPKNMGAALTRNRGVELATGKYLAFLDSDDVWFPEKLEIQIDFMRSKGALFTCTAYNKIDEEGNHLGKIRQVRKRSGYEDILKWNPGNSTVVYDAEALGKIIIPDIRKRNDYVMWLSVVKKAGTLYGIPKLLGSHRIRSGSLSRNKANLVGYHWTVYREIEKLSVLKSAYLVFYWIVVTVFKLR
jgi:teichuronic acid biosynthesis glycosyltransferase TuaG